jgi:hypothetical protein
MNESDYNTTDHSTITLSINGIHVPIKTYRIANQKKKKDHSRNHMLLTRDSSHREQTLV